METQKAIGVIPARAGSHRFPNKPLASILGKPMIQHVWAAATRAKSLSEVLVATDSREIFDVVEGFGGRAVFTTGHFQSGTDRVARVVEELDYPIVVNIQGDEPTLSAKVIDDSSPLVQTPCSRFNL